jgi:hypothetical protein
MSEADRVGPAFRVGALIPVPRLPSYAVPGPPGADDREDHCMHTEQPDPRTPKDRW